ncbi:hypothetical protein RB596_007754, partial [Gaeumannomyces avenae]
PHPPPQPFITLPGPPAASSSSQHQKHQISSTRFDFDTHHIDHRPSRIRCRFLISKLSLPRTPAEAVHLLSTPRLSKTAHKHVSIWVSSDSRDPTSKPLPVADTDHDCLPLLPRPATPAPRRNCAIGGLRQGGATVAQECIEKYNELKLGKSLKYIIFKLSDDNKQIVVEEASGDNDWEAFRNKLINATIKSATGAVSKAPRYAIYDFQYSLSSGEGERNKITFIAWSPDDASIKPKMVYASSKDALKRSLNGIAYELQANDADDIEYDSVLKAVSKGLA